MAILVRMTTGLAFENWESVRSTLEIFGKVVDASKVEVRESSSRVKSDSWGLMEVQGWDGAMESGRCLRFLEREQLRRRRFTHEFLRDIHK